MHEGIVTDIDQVGRQGDGLECRTIRECIIADGGHLVAHRDGSERLPSVKDAVAKFGYVVGNHIVVADGRYQELQFIVSDEAFVVGCAMVSI